MQRIARPISIPHSPINAKWFSKPFYGLLKFQFHTVRLMQRNHRYSQNSPKNFNSTQSD